MHDTLHHKVISMDLKIQQAISHISEIHDHLTRSQVYRGYRSVPVAMTGLVAMVGAIVQPYLVQPTAPLHYVYFWCGLALVNLTLSGSTIVARYVRDTPHQRWQARKAVGQFLPCLAAGALVTGAALHWSSWISLLPGLWSLLFALGIFASRPFLPRAIGFVALFYLIASGLLLWGTHSEVSLAPWAMGATFGVGQLAAAIVLYWKIERIDDIQQSI